jgi:hypothetical protein
MNAVPRQRFIILVFWLWIVVILGLYVDSFGPVIRLVFAHLLP